MTDLKQRNQFSKIKHMKKITGLNHGSAQHALDLTPIALVHKFSKENDTVERFIKNE